MNCTDYYVKQAESGSRIRIRTCVKFTDPNGSGSDPENAANPHNKECLIWIRSPAYTCQLDPHSAPAHDEDVGGLPDDPGHLVVLPLQARQSRLRKLIVKRR
jgi:hypothetical protein